jgi:transitional endoplasmic reticulum ATPase
MSLDLEVQPLTDRLDGYGIVAIPPDTMTRLGVETGDFVSFDHRTDQATAAVQPAAESDETGFAAIGRRLREELDVVEGDQVTVTRLAVDAAHRVVVSLPGSDGSRIDTDELRSRLTYRIVAPAKTLTIPLDDTGTEVTVRVESVTPPRTVGTKGYTTIRIDGVTATPESGRSDRSGDPPDADVRYTDVGGQRAVLREVREVVELPLTEPKTFERFGIDPPSGVLLHGPPGTGKTLIARAVATEADAHFEAISAGEVFSKWFGESESNLREIFQRARRNAPAVVYIDELDAIAADRGENDGPETRVVNELLTQMDGLDARTDVVVMASTNRLDDLDPAVRRPGRFDRELEVGQPDESGRREVLAIHTREVPLADDVDLDALAARTHGYTGADLERVVQEAVLAAIRRVRGLADDDVTTTEVVNAGALQEATVRPEDVAAGLDAVDPSGLRSYRVEVPDVEWADVGGHDDVIDTLREVVEWPRRYPEAFETVDLDPATGVLLYGPPGTGKTLLAKALATETDASFLPVEGPELVGGRAGDTEAAIRDLFETARAHAPSVVYLDEVDALTPARDAAGTRPGAESVVAQLLSELDGLADNAEVTVVAATNRPDRIDEAVLRAGRFDEVLEVGMPDRDARREILSIHTASRPLADDVELDELAATTEGLSAAELAAVCRRASRWAVRRAIEAGDEATPVRLEAADFERGLQTVRTQRDGLGDADPPASADELPTYGFA